MTGATPELEPDQVLVNSHRGSNRSAVATVKEVTYRTEIEQSVV